MGSPLSGEGYRPNDIWKKIRPGPINTAQQLGVTHSFYASKCRCPKQEPQMYAAVSEVCTREYMPFV